MFCPYRSAEEWRALDSEDLKFAIEVDEAIRGGIAGSSKELFVHRSLIPLADEPYAHVDSGQFDLFNDECEGLCGV